MPEPTDPPRLCGALIEGPLDMPDLDVLESYCKRRAGHDGPCGEEPAARLGEARDRLAVLRARLDQVRARQEDPDA